MIGPHRGAGGLYGVPLLDVPGRVLRGCGSGPCYVSGKALLPIPYGRGVGDCLGRVTSLYNVGGGLAARATQRDFTSIVTLTGGISLPGITGVLKRSSAEVARRCTGMLSRAVLGSVRRIRGRLSV